MQITCPACASDFDVPLALIGTEGRKLRCASCRHVWFQEGIKPDLPQPDTPVYQPLENGPSATGFEIDFGFDRPPEPEIPSFHEMLSTKDKKAKKPTKDKDIKFGKAPAWGNMAASAAVVSLLLSLLLVLGRQGIADASPFMRKAYTGLGLAVTAPGEGIGIDRLLLKPVWSEKGAKIELSTRLLNLTDREIALTPLVVEALDEKGQPYGDTWRFEPPAATLPPEGGVPFTAMIEGAEPKGESLVLQLRVAP